MIIIVMNIIVIYMSLGLLGLCFGSFAGATVWRLRTRQLEKDKKFGHMEKSELDEYKKLKKISKKRLTKDRSVCLHCSYELRWYDLIPIFSWVSLRGRCRKCSKPIGYLEPLVEIGAAILFISSYVFWPSDLSVIFNLLGFIIWLVSCVLLIIAVAYDFKWSIIPDEVNFSMMGIGALNAVMFLFYSGFSLGSFISVMMSVVVLSGLYLFIYIISKGRWIGFGDVKLGLALGLLMCNWKLAILALFLANFIGCLVIIPLLMMKKVSRSTRIPFGPLFVAGFIISKFFGGAIINLYLSLLSM